MKAEIPIWTKIAKKPVERYISSCIPIIFISCYCNSNLIPTSFSSFQLFIMRSSISIVLFSLPFLNAAGTGNLGTSTTQNGLTDSSGCKAMTVIFARGTTEQGNVGTLSGPPFFAALAQAVGTENLDVQGVDYPADIPGFLAGGDANGSKTMAQLVTQAMTQCPDTKVVMSGYRYVSSSSGASQVVDIFLVMAANSFTTQQRC